MNLADILILILLFLIFYTFIFYPILLKILSIIFYNPVNKNESINNKTLTIIISAYNEENLIEDAIHSIFKSNYPTENIYVKIGSDGSSDNTFIKANNLKSIYPNLDVFEFDRLGKNTVLNELCKDLKTHYVFYMDADIRILPNTIQKMINNLNDDKVGAVICPMISKGSNDFILDEQIENSGFKGESLYQDYDSFIKIHESKIYSTAGSLGAFYGINYKYYKPLPNNNVADDYVSLMFVAEKKKRIFYDENNTVYEVREKDLNNQFTRRIRITAGLGSSIWFGMYLLNPKYGWYSFFLLSHKFIRFLVPGFMVSIILLLFLSVNNIVYNFTISLYLLVLMLSGIGLILDKLKIRISLFALPLYFFTMSIGQLIAYFKMLSLKNISIWTNEK